MIEETNLNSPEFNYAYLYSVPSRNKFISSDDESAKKKERIDSLVRQLFQRLTIDEFEEFYRMKVNHEVKAFERKLRYEPDELDIAIIDFFDSFDAMNHRDSPKYSIMMRVLSCSKMSDTTTKEFNVYRMFLAIRQHMNTENNYVYIDIRHLPYHEMTQERYEIRKTLNNKLINQCYHNSKESDNVSHYSKNQYNKLITNVKISTMYPISNVPTTYLSHEIQKYIIIEDYLVANLLKNPEFIVEYPNDDKFVLNRIQYEKIHMSKSYLIKEHIQDMRKIFKKYYEKKADLVY